MRAWWVLLLVAAGCGGEGSDTDSACEGDDCAPPVPEDAERSETGGNDGMAFEVCPGTEMTVNVGGSEVWVHAGGVVNVTAGEVTVYAEAGAEVNVVGAGVTVYGDPADVIDADTEPTVVECVPVIACGGC